jgi:Amt family ammonium transporter
VVGVHLVGGLVGAVSLGFIAAYPFLPQQHKGLFYGGGFQQLGWQVIAPISVGVYSFVVAFVLGKIIDVTIGFRSAEEDEVAGLDLSTHAETAYDFAPSHGALPSAVRAPAADGAPADKKVEAEA